MPPQKPIPQRPIESSMAFCCRAMSCSVTMPISFRSSFELTTGAWIQISERRTRDGGIVGVYTATGTSRPAWTDS